MLRPLFVLICSVSLNVAAQPEVTSPKDSAAYSLCLSESVIKADDQLSVAEIKSLCAAARPKNALDERIQIEQRTQDKEFVITPYRQNYLLLATYNDKPNQAPWETQGSFAEYAKPFKHEEVKMQLSFKVPLNKHDIFFENDNIYFGFTMKSFWQVYNKKISAPFRETNYRPEVFYQAPLETEFMEGGFFLRAGFEHESNGRSQWLSRSWNRIYAGLGYQRDNWALYMQPWYRLPESDKVYTDEDPATPPPAKGDDNPDISDYMGFYEFYAIYDHPDFQLSHMLRHNFSTGKGAVELGVSFPLYHRIKGYVQFFNGYGESMIDYDHLVQRIGIGVLLTDFL